MESGPHDTYQCCCMSWTITQPIVPIVLAVMIINTMNIHFTAHAKNGFSDCNAL